MNVDDGRTIVEEEARSDVDEYGDDDCGVEESDADYRARLMQVDTFLRLNETIDSLQVFGKRRPEYSREVQKLLQSSHGDKRPGAEASGQSEPLGTRYAAERRRDAGDVGTEGFDGTGGDETVEVKTHAHIIYHGDLLQFSKETITLTVTKRDMTLFTRIIGCFEKMIMGAHTEREVGAMRRDYEALVEMWNDASNGGGEELNIGGELNNMVRSMLDTPLYYSNSCMAIIACGQMLRNLYAATEGEDCESYERLLDFVRRHMRHNTADPFACDCDGGGCSRVCKTLMSMIMEVPNVVHNQTYVLQILAYMLYNKAGREEVFVNNLKNTCSPGLLDRVPTRVSLLLGTLDETEIKRLFRTIRQRTRHLNPLRGGRTAYTKYSLERLVQLAQHPQVRGLIESLPGACAATVELRLPKCSVGKRQCLNREFDEETIAERQSNNGGKNKCCGYLRQDPSDMLVSSIALTQTLIYVFTDSRTASTRSRKHFFTRDIITSMAKQSVKIKIETLEEMFCYLDRTSVFKSFSEHPFMMSALHELFTTYIDSMKDVAKKYKEAGKKRRIKRYLQKNGYSGDVK